MKGAEASLQYVFFQSQTVPKSSGVINMAFSNQKLIDHETAWKSSDR